ncbi:MAG: signal peptidase I [Cyanobacteria bacterium]|nr:signal peptidase I [Cyanobacteriota bacterium]MDA0865829.1 signal peptidase I [Cyanobacteriota bacterium]
MPLKSQQPESPQTPPQDSESSPQTAAAANATTSATPSQWQRFWQSQRDNIRVLGVALVIAIVMRLWVAEPRFIPSNSMEPTLQIGDRLIVEKVSYYLHAPEAGDIVVFRPPPQLYPYGYGPHQAFIKRVVAGPGQTVTVTGQQVYVDGEPLREPYIQAPPAYEMAPVTVPPGMLFVLGDNRNNSNDSHVWGVLPQSNVIGRAYVRFWPIAQGQFLAETAATS